MPCSKGFIVTQFLPTGLGTWKSDFKQKNLKNLRPCKGAIFQQRKGFDMNNMDIIGKGFVSTFKIPIKHLGTLNHSSARAQYLEPSLKNWVIIFGQKIYLLKWFRTFWKLILFKRGRNEVSVAEIWFGLLNYNSHNFIYKFRKQNKNAQNLPGVAGTTLLECIFLAWRNVATMAIYTWLDSQNAVLSRCEDWIALKITGSSYWNLSQPWSISPRIYGLREGKDVPSTASLSA